MVEKKLLLCLIPDVVNAINIPLIAAGSDGKSMLSAMILGATEYKWVLDLLPAKNPRLMKVLKIWF